MSADSEPAATVAAERRARTLLAFGALVGLASAAASILHGGPALERKLPDGAVAAVNGSAVRLEEYQRAVAALASDRRTPIDDSDKRHVLDRLIEEELLVQRGLELGLAQSDRRVRGDLVAAVIQAAISESETEEPDDAALAAFYAENRDYFARSGRVAVRQILVRAEPTRDDAQARARADEAASRLRAGEPFAEVEQALGDPQVAVLPADPLPLSKLREYLGPTATRAAESLSPGDVAAPVRSNAGYHVLVGLAREPGDVPPIDEIREPLRAEMRRRAGDAALRAYLDDLRRRAEVRTVDALP